MKHNAVTPASVRGVDVDMVSDLAAYDLLPKPLRKVLRETRYEMSSEVTLRALTDPASPVFGDAKMIALQVRNHDLFVSLAARREGMSP